MYEAATPIKLTDTRYPDWAGLDLSWYLYRLTYNGGVLYRQRYLEQFSGEKMPTISTFVETSHRFRTSCVRRCSKSGTRSSNVCAMCCGLAAVSRINWQYPA